MVCCATDSRSSLDSLTSWIAEIRSSFIQGEEKPIVVILTKKDRLAEIGEDEDKVTEVEIESYVEENALQGYFVTSSKVWSSDFNVH